MKKITLLFAGIILASCATEPKDYVTLSGKIENQNSDSLVIRSRAYSKTIAVAADGSFKDTLKVEDGLYNLFDGSESTGIYLKNGYDLKITIDTKEFDETIIYKGNGSDNNNFLATFALKQENILNQDFDSMDRETLNSTIDKGEKELTSFIEENQSLDSIVLASSKTTIERGLPFYKEYFGKLIDLREKLNGKPAPEFNDYQNFDGSTTSLSDLKGKYVYVDVWATWCGPCKREIPFLKAVEKKYHDKNIAFVSLSVDDDRRSGSWEKAESDWKAMVADKELGGIQILSPKGWQSDFVQDYEIQGIPRFILIGPDGNTVEASAPRPSDEKLIDLFNKHNI
ncbi:TlpA disulfide reductase family protein [Urechidicola sp. KH5]